MRDSITARAAEAAWRATIPAVDDKGIGWDEMASHTRDVFRTMARAVIDALGLTEEYATRYDTNASREDWETYTTPPLPKGIAEANVRLHQGDPCEWMRNPRLVSRLVTNWEEQ